MVSFSRPGARSDEAWGMYILGFRFRTRMYSRYQDVETCFDLNMLRWCQGMRSLTWVWVYNTKVGVCQVYGLWKGFRD